MYQRSASGIQWEIAGGINALLVFLSINPTNQLYNHPTSSSSPSPSSSSSSSYSSYSSLYLSLCFYLNIARQTFVASSQKFWLRIYESLVQLVSGVNRFVRFKLSDFLFTNFVLDYRRLITIFLNSRFPLKELNRWPPNVILWKGIHPKARKILTLFC